MEKKLILAFVLVAALSLVWVFSFMCRNEHQTDFTASNMSLYAPAKSELAKAKSVNLTDNELEIGQTEISNIVSNPETGIEKIEKVRVTVKNSNTVGSSKINANSGDVKGLKSNDALNFCIETFQLQPSNKWLNEYEFNYKRIRGNFPVVDESVQILIPEQNSKALKERAI
jgi:hypothetical protein